MIRKQTHFAATLMPRERDSEVGTLEDPDEGNDPLISLGIIWNMSDDLIGMMECEWWPRLYQANMRIRYLMKMISYNLGDVNALFEGNVSGKIWKGAYLKNCFQWVPIIWQVHNDSFTRISIGFSDMHYSHFLTKRSLTWWFYLNSLTTGVYMWTKCYYYIQFLNCCMK